MKVTFLGTSGAFPTAQRNGTAHVVWVQGETLLLDCGESTQRQLRRSNARLSVQRIFLSHLHLDHTLGLPGYVGTMNLLQRTEPLKIYAPRGTRPQIEHLLAPNGRLGFAVGIEELEDGAVVKAEGFRVIAARVEHQGPALGFRIEEDERPGKVDVDKARSLGIPPGPLVGQLLRDGQITVNGKTIRVGDIAGPPRPGRSIVYSGDTRPCRTLAALAKNADLLIHESTFTTEYQEEAVARGHSTSAEAAQIARDAGIRRLALTHISQRHQEVEEIKKMVREGRAVFAESFLPDDLDEVEIPLAP